MPNNLVKISVRNMVEFVMRSGDIDVAYRGANRALEGTRVHQNVQRQKKSEAKASGALYKSEYFLSATHLYKDITFQVEGRADGIQTGDGTVIVDEIKSTFQPLAQLEMNPDHWHWAQAKCYGHMYIASLSASNAALATDSAKPQATPEGLTITLTYCHVESGESRVFLNYFTAAALAEFFESLIKRYWIYAQMDIDRLSERNETAKALTFPFGAYRRGQRELAVAVFTIIKQKRKLFTQAPTGIGKTISTLFPSVKSLAEGFGEKIFYITAKAVARQVAEEAFKHMLAQGLRMRVLTITARDKICFCETRACNPVDCPYAKGHFDRINEAIVDCVRHTLLINRAAIEEYARKHQVCPAEFQLDIALFCDTVICDYNHVYDPKSKLQRFFQLGGDYILLNDEAHNLIDRARDMFSAGLYKNDYAALRKEIGKNHPLYKSLGAIVKEIGLIGKDRENKEPFCMSLPPETLPPLLVRFAEHCDIHFQDTPEDPHTEALLGLYFSTLDYLRVAELFDERYTFYSEPLNGYIRLYCLDPSYLLQQEQKKSRACVFFSATLTPLAYFRALLGGEIDDFTLRLASPFPRSHLSLLVDNRVSTRYKDRALSYKAIAERLYAMISGKMGNYMVFFPSYAYLSEVHTAFTEQYPAIKTRIQSSDMNDENRALFLEAFTENPIETQLVFVVLGGAFSEGVDLAGHRLIGAAVVGVGLPLISAERNVIMDYYNRQSGEGFEFAYIYPGMNKVLQAAGRVIRTETDRGVVLLIDSRFTESSYQSLFPPEWAGYERVKNSRHIQDAVQAFWED